MVTRERQKVTSEILLTCGAGVLFNLFLRFYSVGGKPIFFRSVFSSLDTIFQSLVLHSNGQITGQQEDNTQNRTTAIRTRRQRRRYPEHKTPTTQNTTHDDTPPTTKNQHTRNNHINRDNINQKHEDATPSTNKDKYKQSYKSFVCESASGTNKNYASNGFPPVDLRAVCFVRAILLIYDFYLSSIYHHIQFVYPATRKKLQSDWLITKTLRI